MTHIASYRPGFQASLIELSYFVLIKESRISGLRIETFDHIQTCSESSR
jgi:hypothetical protein